jgi:hypothetical protein
VLSLIRLQIARTLRLRNSAFHLEPDLDVCASLPLLTCWRESNGACLLKSAYMYVQMRTWVSTSMTTSSRTRPHPVRSQRWFHCMVLAGLRAFGSMMSVLAAFGGDEDAVAVLR